MADLATVGKIGLLFFHESHESHIKNVTNEIIRFSIKYDSESYHGIIVTCDS